MGTRAVLLELVPMVSEKYEVTLIMPGDDSSLFELGVLRKQTGNHSAKSRAQHGVKVVQNQFGSYFVHAGVGSMVLDLAVQFDARNSERGCWSLWKMTQYHAVWVAPLLLEDHDVREISVFAPFDDLLDAEVFSRIILTVWKSEFQLLQEVKDGAFRSSVRGNQDFWSCFTLEVLCKFINILFSSDVLIIDVTHQGFVCDSHALDGFILAFWHLVFSKFLSELFRLQLLQLCLSMLDLSPLDDYFLSLMLILDLFDLSLVFAF